MMRELQVGYVPLMLADLTWPEVQRHVEEDAVVLLPVGAFEQHGPGMTLETDTRLATELCRHVSARLFPRVLVAPPVPWGLSDHHLGFAGTISLRRETFFLVIRDVVMSLLRHGFRRIMLVNGHGGNMAASEEVCLRLRRKIGADVLATVTYFTLTSLPVEALEHAGEIETSYALALAPQIVRPDRLVPAEIQGPVPAPSDTTSLPAFHTFSRTGNLGDPTRASRACGQDLVEAVLDRLCERVITFGGEGGASHPLTAGKENSDGACTGEPDHQPATR